MNNLTSVKTTADLATVLCQASPFDIKQICDYEVLSSDEIAEYVVKFVQEINGIVELNTAITRMLLIHCKWDKTVMTDRLFQDDDKLYTEAHVINPARANSVAPQADDKECGICLLELAPSMSAESTCGHQFCTSCWSEYLKVKIMDEGVAESIACAANGCNMIIGDERVIQLVGDEKAKIRYRKLITNSFVQRNETLRWCPAPGCSFVIKVTSVAPNPICCYCKCGYEFCFDCSKEYHAPVTCALLRQYEKQLGLFAYYPIPDDYVRIRPSRYEGKIKICPNPNCQLPLQKYDGCNVVKCTNCDSVFCWQCLKRYSSKSDAYSHRCKAIENDEKKEPVEAMTEVAPDVPVTSTQLPTNTVNDDTNKELAVGTAEATTHVSVTSSEYNDVHHKHSDAVFWLQTAHRSFVKNRKWLKECCAMLRHDLTEFERASLEWVRTWRTLKYALLFAIYAVDTVKLTLLQNLIQNLEEAATNLSKFIYPIIGPFPIDDFEELHEQITKHIIPAYKNCQRRRRALLDCVDEGFSKEWWTFKTEP